MAKLERLKKAVQRCEQSEAALVGFALYHLPDRVRKRLIGDDGGEDFVLSATLGYMGLIPPELKRSYGEVSRRAHHFLIAIPRFRNLLDAYHDAWAEWYEADDQVEKSREEYERSIQETYDMIERDMWDDVREECKQLGLVG